MDSKTRHELEQNELAKWITHQYEDWIQPNKSWLGYAVLGLLIVVAIIFVTAYLNTRNRNAEWKDFYAALNSVDPDASLVLVADSIRSTVGTHARLALAQRQLAKGSAQTLTDKSEAIVLLGEAISSFQRVQKATSDPLVLQQAGFGLGQCWETLAVVRVGDDLAKAEEEYRKVIERREDGFMGQRAQKQLALIQRPATRMFLERMAAKVPEMSEGMDNFRVTIDPSDHLAPGGFDLDRFGQSTPTEVQILNTESAQTPNEQIPEEQVPEERKPGESDSAQ